MPKGGKMEFILSEDGNIILSPVEESDQKDCGTLEVVVEEAVLTDEGAETRTSRNSNSPVGVHSVPTVSAGETIDDEGRHFKTEYIWMGKLKTRDDYKATRILIDLVAQKYDALNDCKVQKNKIWEEFAQIIMNEGFKISDDLESAGKKCDQKWRNLKRTYINYNTRTPVPGKVLRRPPSYFKKLELVLGKVTEKDSGTKRRWKKSCEIEPPVMMEIEENVIPEESPSNNKRILEDALQGRFTNTSRLSSISCSVTSPAQASRPSVSTPSIIYTEPENVGNQILDVLNKFMKAEEKRFEILRDLLKENMKEKKKVNSAFMEYLRSVTPNAAALKRKREEENV